MKLHNLGGTACPIARSVVAVGDYWSLLIVQEVLHGAHRFSEIQRNLGLAKNILSARLKKLVEWGIIETKPGGAHQAYVLTAKGADLQDVLASFARWGDRWLPAGLGAPAMPGDAVASLPSSRPPPAASASM